LEKTKILIAYGTRYGATASTAEEISKILLGEGFEVRVVNLKEAKVKDISKFEFVIIGSGMKMDMWTSKAKAFLNKFSGELKKKKVAIFVSSGARALMEYKGEHDEINRITKKYLENKASKYDLNPISMTMFGGIWDYNQIGKIYRKFINAEKENFIPAGIKETEPGVYDSRNWDEIRKWAKELANQI
jgi:menaquinone-dependent protoporphyrinogen IX oxidase